MYIHKKRVHKTDFVLKFRMDYIPIYSSYVSLSINIVFQLNHNLFESTYKLCFTLFFGVKTYYTKQEKHLHIVRDL